ncbi:exosome complex component RRP42 [Halyomorpha halys]|uniref:exosome complex component RRP42 n=1 Tax=Halyomorpha halys TaxID=286706 RepID=UPI0006D4CE87|nr:exosome complex component RRP42 [Halyomorpha halys]
MVRLSPEEKIYIIHGVEDNIREDGRTQMQYRSIEVETGIIPSAMGSARIKLGNTDVIACVKADTFTPTWNKPDEGKLQLHVDLSATASPRFEGRRGEQTSEEITTILNKAYESIKLESFCIVPQVKCWLVDVDISVLSCDGNMYDAIGFAVKAALATAMIPKIVASDEDEGEKELQITDDPFDTWTPNVSNVPCLVTLSKVGDSVMIDATNKEEQCSSFTCILAVTETGKILSTFKVGPGSVQPATFSKLILEASSIGKSLHSELLSALKKEQGIRKREIHGFLN